MLDKDNKNNQKYVPPNSYLLLWTCSRRIDFSWGRRDGRSIVCGVRRSVTTASCCSGSSSICYICTFHFLWFCLYAKKDMDNMYTQDRTKQNKRKKN